MASKLPASFYRRADVVLIGRELLGKMLCTRIGCRTLTAGIIVETEAYGGARDCASHAFGYRHTPRTAIMFAAGGVAYVYLCYGLHALFNIITNRAGEPDAVLIRAVQPVRGLPTMRRRRGPRRPDRALAFGPGAVTRALGIGLRHNGLSLLGDTIWLEPGIEVAPAAIRRGPRIGVDYAGADARRPWRFWLPEA